MIVLQIVPLEEAMTALAKLPEEDVLWEPLASPAFTVPIDYGRCFCVRQVRANHGREGTAPYRLEILGQITGSAKGPH